MARFPGAGSKRTCLRGRDSVSREHPGGLQRAVGRNADRAVADSPRHQRAHHRDRASAVLHRAQRGKDAAGRIVATLDDYGHAHAAFDGRIGGALSDEDPGHRAGRRQGGRGHGRDDGAWRQDHRFGADGETRDHRARGRRLASQSRGRVRFSQAGGHGEGGARIYELGKTSAEVAALIEFGSAGQCVFPKMEDVKKHVLNLSVPPRYAGTVGTNWSEGAAIPSVRAYLSGTEPFESDFSETVRPEKPKASANSPGWKFET